MLHLLLGRSKTGKTSALLRTTGERGACRPQIYLVPEQYSHEAERRLCAELGNRAAARCEVLSFTRLYTRVLTAVGGGAEAVLDNGGRLLLMHEAVEQMRASLAVYQKTSRKAAFLQGLLEAADELKSYCVQPISLIEAGTSLGGEAGGRLRDLGLILNAYDALTAERAADPRDRLTRLKEKLLESGYARGRDFYLDCFTDFIPQEKAVLSVLLRDAREVTVALTCDSLSPDGDTVFSPARRTALELLRLAEREHVGAEFRTLEGRVCPCPEALNRAERVAFSDASALEEIHTEGSGQAIRLTACSDSYEEVEQAAGEIRRLVQSGACRYRDIVVTARTMEGYDDLIERIFTRYEIPVFQGRRENILESPILLLLTSALDALDGYEYEPIFRYLRTGLAGVTPEETDRLENYVLQWNLRGSAWTQEQPWNWNPAGYAMPWDDADKAEVVALDALRRSIVAPLEQLRKTPDAGGASMARILYAFLEEIALPARLEERAEELTERGALQQAEEYRQLWDILVNALEQCSSLLGEAPMSLREFSDLFRLILSQYSVSTIPVSLDRVTVGEILRIAHREAKVAFVLGADDLHFPLVQQEQGLLTQEDRSYLASCGCPLKPPPEQRIDREQTLAYDAVCLPTEHLFLSWATETGSTARPARFVERLQALFPGLKAEKPDPLLRCTAPLPALDWAAGTGNTQVPEALSALPGWEDRIARINEAKHLERGRLSRGMVDRLYGWEVHISASRIDNIRSCHFGYFLQYGLRVKPRREASFDAPQVGTFIHYVLEHLLREAQPQGGIKALEQEAIKTLTAKVVEQYVSEVLGGLENQNPRFRYLFERLLESVDLIVANLTDELKRSRFQPIAFELGFGTGKELPPVTFRADGITLVLSGFVDRVDGWAKDGKLYLRVVDYKSGNKVFDLTEVWHGLQMQMLLYLFTLQDEGKALFQAKELIPAGVLYTQVHEVNISGRRDITEAELQKETDRALRRSGLLLQNADVLDAMEHVDRGQSPRFLPVRVSKTTGEISGDSLASAAQWGLLHNHIQDVLRQIAGELAAGNIDADPYLHGGRTPCDWCELKAACLFERGQGCDRIRYLYRVRGKEFWEAAAAKNTEQTGKEGRK